MSKKCKEGKKWRGWKCVGFEVGEGTCNKALVVDRDPLKAFKTETKAHIRQAVGTLFYVKVLAPQVQCPSTRQSPPVGASRPLYLEDNFSQGHHKAKVVCAPM